MTWHIVEGDAGCAFARDSGFVAVIVDALRASATVAMLFDAGAAEVRVVREVAEAIAEKERVPEALLFGERGGLPPEGFDFGNSPRTTQASAGRTIIFTTTNGAACLVDAFGAAAVYMGTTLNAAAIVGAASGHSKDVVLIPASRTGDRGTEAQEDWAAATAIAMLADAPIGEGASEYRGWRGLVEFDGLPKLFETAPHAEELRAIGLGEDVAYCARLNVTEAVPRVVARNGAVVTLKEASSPHLES